MRKKHKKDKKGYNPAPYGFKAHKRHLSEGHGRLRRACNKHCVYCRHMRTLKTTRALLALEE